MTPVTQLRRHIHVLETTPAFTAVLSIFSLLLLLLDTFLLLLTHPISELVARRRIVCHWGGIYYIIGRPCSVDPHPWWVTLFKVIPT